MATLRFLHTDFWKDDFFMELTPEDKYFYIYLLTNDRCSQCGIYHFGVKFAAVELGYSEDTVKTLLSRFVKHGKILYNDKHGEVMIINWYKYNMNLNNKNTRVCINTCLKKIKTVDFIKNFYHLCREQYQSEMNYVEEIFSGVSFSGLKDSRAIIESHRDEVIGCCNCGSEGIIESNGEDSSHDLGKSEEGEEISQNHVDKSIEFQSLCYKNVDKSKNCINVCGNLLLDNNEEGKVIEVFQNNFHPITPMELEKLMDWSRDMSPEVVIKAMEVATFSNKRNMTYLNGILRNWFESGIKTVEDYERMCRENAEFKAKEKKSKEVTPPQYRILPTERYEDEEDF